MQSSIQHIILCRLHNVVWTYWYIAKLTTSSAYTIKKKIIKELRYTFYFGFCLRNAFWYYPYSLLSKSEAMAAKMQVSCVCTLIYARTLTFHALSWDAEGYLQPAGLWLCARDWYKLPRLLHSSPSFLADVCQGINEKARNAAARLPAQANRCSHRPPPVLSGAHSAVRLLALDMTDCRLSLFSTRTHAHLSKGHQHRAF